MSKWTHIRLELELNNELAGEIMTNAIVNAFTEAGKLAALKMTLFDDSVGRVTLKKYDPDNDVGDGYTDIPLVDDDESS